MKVFEAFVAIARPSRNDSVGAVEPGFYVVNGGEVILTNENGEPIASGRMALGYSAKVGEDEAPEIVAKRLIWRRYRATKGNSDFNRRLDYSHQRGWR
jgi:hypothetical protein